MCTYISFVKITTVYMPFLFIRIIRSANLCKNVFKDINFYKLISAMTRAVSKSIDIIIFSLYHDI